MRLQLNFLLLRCQQKKMLAIYFRLLSGLVTTIIVTCTLWIPVTALLFYLLGVWIRQRSKSLLPQLRKPLPGGQKPVVVGLFHPYCNAGGGGERVLWTAIRALQNKYKHCRFVVYTGDTDVTGNEILAKAQECFNITLPTSDADTLQFVFLNRRQWVEASPYPLLTLLGQSLGSIVLGFEAIFKYVPDVYIDTMGYAFTIPLFRYLGGCQVGCYVHYPTISTDMLERVSSRTMTYNNASFISRSPVLSYIKLLYYRLFAYAYGVAGNRSDVVMVNSTWTQGHILQLWQARDRTHIVYPPCDTKQFIQIPENDDSGRDTLNIISVAQFRPEKDHTLQIKAFSEFLKQLKDVKVKEGQKGYKLVLLGSCRNAEDSARVDALKSLSKSLEIEDQVKFCLNVPFPELKSKLGEATVGLHTMWNEHFGIGVVEMQAAGLVVLAHNSGGPKLDIVTEYEGQPTGYLADDVTTYSQALVDIFSMPLQHRMDIKMNARRSVHRFSEENFEQGFLSSVEMFFQ